MWQKDFLDASEAQNKETALEQCRNVMFMMIKFVITIHLENLTPTILTDACQRIQIIHNIVVCKK